MRKTAILFLICVVLLAIGLNACATAILTTSPIQTPTLTELPWDCVQPVTPAAVLPYVSHCNCEPTVTPTPTPTPTVTLEIYNCAGEIASTWWLTMTYGDVRYSLGDLAELWCSVGPSVIVVHVENAAGEPVEGATAVLYYDDAPDLPGDMVPNPCNMDRGVFGPTNAEGNLGFGLGSGSYYFPPAGGPHLLWVDGGKSCLAGIGMLALTEHQTLWPTWQTSGLKIDAARGFSRVSVIYETTVSGHKMWVIRVP